MNKINVSWLCVCWIQWGRRKVLLGVSYQLVRSLGGLLRCGGVMGQIWRSTCTSRGHRLLTYQEVKVERLIAPLLVGALGQLRWCGKRGDIWMTGEGGDGECEQNISVIFSTLRRDSRLVWTLNHTLTVRHRNTTFSPPESTYRLVWCVCWPGRGETSATEEENIICTHTKKKLSIKIEDATGGSCHWKKDS